MSFLPAELIKKKRRGESHTSAELEYLVNEYTSGAIADYQMSAWLMAVCFQGMNPEETAEFTRCMRDSGRVLDFSDLDVARVDKHSTGGVGDKTSLILAPLVAAAGVAVPMIAGRGLGHTGGTLDKLESLQGFNVRLSLDEFAAQVRNHGVAIIGQTEEICPADRKLYALRDVTGTIDSLPLICASIMSKKLAEGLSGLVLDVKFGSGAFMKTLEQARQLAESLSRIGQHNGVKVSALLTNMNQPLGRYVGNALEVKECLDILDPNGEHHPMYHDTRELSLQLAGEMIFVGGQVSSSKDGYERARELLESGEGLRLFTEMARRQGAKDLKALPSSEPGPQIVANKDGFVYSMDVEQIGLAAIHLGAGRRQSTDKIDPSAGIEMHTQVGQQVRKGQPLMTIFGGQSHQQQEAIKTLEAAVQIGDSTPTPTALISQVLREKSV